MVLRQVLEFALELISERVNSKHVTQALELVIPYIVDMAAVDRFDAQARARLQASIDDALRAARLI